MAEATRLPRYSLEEYSVLEETSNVRHEYLDGHIYAMAGGTPEHGGPCANLIAILSNALEGRPCRVFTSDVRVRIQATGLDTYPDASVVCGRIERDSVDRNALTNPVVLAEVEVWRRGGDGSWSAASSGSGALIRLVSLEAELKVDAVYRNPLPD